MLDLQCGRLMRRSDQNHASKSSVFHRLKMRPRDFFQTPLHTRLLLVIFPSLSCLRPMSKRTFTYIVDDTHAHVDSKSPFGFSSNKFAAHRNIDHIQVCSTSSTPHRDLWVCFSLWYTNPKNSADGSTHGFWNCILYRYGSPLLLLDLPQTSETI